MRAVHALAQGMRLEQDMGWAVTHSRRWLPGGIFPVTPSTALLGPEPWVSLSQVQSSSLSSTYSLSLVPTLPSNQEGSIQHQ